MQARRGPLLGSRGLVCELTPEQVAAACASVTPELLGESILAGNLADVTAEVRRFVEAGVRHVLLWNIGVLATGVAFSDLARMAVLVRRLRKVPLPSRSAFLAGVRPHEAPLEAAQETVERRAAG